MTQSPILFERFQAFDIEELTNGPVENSHFRFVAHTPTAAKLLELWGDVNKPIKIEPEYAPEEVFNLGDYTYPALIVQFRQGVNAITKVHDEQDAATFLLGREMVFYAYGVPEDYNLATLMIIAFETPEHRDAAFAEVESHHIIGSIDKLDIILTVNETAPANKAA